MMGIAILLLIVAVTIGFYEGRVRAHVVVVILTAIAIFGVSNLVVSWPWFGSSASTWISTYSYGLLQTGILSFAIHVVPFIGAYLIGKKTGSRR